MSINIQTGHIGLNVTNLERSSQFYRQVFGFEEVRNSVDEGRRFAFLGDGQNLTLTLWEQSRDHFEKDRAGLHHLSFQVESVHAVEEAQARLKELGVAFIYEGIVAHSEGAGSGGIFFEDPDGIRLEIYSPAGVHAPAVAEGPACGFF